MAASDDAHPADPSGGTVYVVVRLGRSTQKETYEYVEVDVVL
jgi:Pyruvate/2-oxoacid:ferredoxin oxidoreductase gamma subunit